MNNKERILSQKLFQSERKIPLRWLVAISALPLFGVVAAFGIAPDTEVQHMTSRTVVEDLSLPTIQLSADQSKSFWREERIQRGDTVSSLLNRLNVNSGDAQSFLKEARHAQAFRQLKPGKNIQALTTQDGELISLRYHYGGDSMLLIDKQEGHFKTSEQPLTLERREEM
ncbi:MAG: M23 family peptidase, partial [Sulfurimicrobium sp.]|nr:M23 family peptidase [Sulfurimicrobium sp.]